METIYIKLKDIIDMSQIIKFDSDIINYLDEELTNILRPYIKEAVELIEKSIDLALDIKLDTIHSIALTDLEIIKGKPSVYIIKNQTNKRNVDDILYKTSREVIRRLNNIEQFYTKYGNRSNDYFRLFRSVLEVSKMLITQDIEERLNPIRIIEDNQELIEEYAEDISLELEQGQEYDY